ncbi:MAG TPA: M28 family metallopeptidase [bacterium]|nr:M28 family metallopeptidase [bacterium]
MTGRGEGVAMVEWGHDLAPDRAWRDVEWLTAHAPERINGTADERRAAEYFREALSAAGVASTIHEFPAYVSVPVEGSLRVRTPADEPIHCAPCAHILSTPPGGVEGDLLPVGAGGEEDYAAVDAAGKIVMADVSYAPPTPEKGRLAARHGARALILVNWGDPDSPLITWRAIKGVWGNPTPSLMGEIPQIPALGIARRDGERLRALAARGPVRVRLVARATREWTHLPLPEGRLEAGETFLLVGGHYDAWRLGVSDNATGNAATLELARVLAAHRGELRRGVRFVFWTGHEIGDMEGSTWYVDRFWDELDAGAVLYLNLDTVGMVGTARWGTQSSDEIVRWHQGVERSHLSVPLEQAPLARTGDQSFFGIGVPSLSARFEHTREQMAAWHGATLGWWNHTDQDTVDKIDRQLFAESLRVYLAYAVGIATSRILPFEFASMGARMVGELDEIAAASRGHLDLAEPRARAGDVAALAARLDAAAALPVPDDVAVRIDAALRRLSRILTPIRRTVSGRWSQDSYGLTALRRPFPMLAMARALPTLEGEPYELWRTQLVRHRNQVADGLRDAVRVLSTVLAEVGA